MVYIVLIGVIKKGDKLLGFRLLDVETQRIKDVAYSSVEGLLRNKDIQIYGLEYENGKVVGSNGSLERYPVIYDGKLIEKPSLIILYQYINNGDTIGYMVADWKGKIVKAKVEDVVRYVRGYGIANGALKVVNGKEIITPICGEYKKVEVKIDKKVVEDTIQKFREEEWSLRDFEEYMSRNGYDCEIYNNVIKFKCPQAKVLKLPSGIGMELKKISNIVLDSLEEIIIPGCVTCVDVELFKYAPNLKRIYFQDGAKTLELIGIKGDKDNRDLYKLEWIRFPSTVIEIENGVRDLYLQEVDLSNTRIKEIKNCFNRVGGLSRIKLPKTVTEIYSAFIGLPDLKELTLDCGLLRICDGFKDCGLVKVDLSNCSILEEIDAESFSGCTYLKEIKLPDIKSIGYKSFRGCAIEKLDLSNIKMVSIGSLAFEGCSRLHDLKLPNNLRGIGDKAFSNCENLRQVIIPNSVEVIDEGAFSRCKLLEVYIGHKVNLRNYAFYGCNKLILQGLHYIPGYFCNSLCDVKIELDKNTSYIGKGAFKGCDVYELKGLRNLEYIGVSAFEASKLEEVDLRDSNKLESIEKWAFAYCRNLKRVILPEGLVSLGDKVFERCSRLDYVVLPRSLTNIGKSIFYGASESVKIYVYNGSKAHEFFKRNKVRHIVIESLDDVFKLESNDRDVDEAVLNKVSMLIGLKGDIHNELLEEPYKHYADILYNIYQYMNKKGVHEDVVVSIDVYSNKNIIEHKGLYNKLKSLDYNSNLDYKEVIDRGLLTSRFKVLYKLISKAMPHNEYILRNEFISYISSLDSLGFVVYRDDHSVILECDYTIDSVRFKSLYVVIGNRLVYASIIDDIDTVKYKKFIFKNYCKGDKYRNSISKYVIENDLLPIDTVTNNNKIHGAICPKYIADDIAKSIKYNWVLIYTNYKSLNKVTRLMNADGIFLCLETGKIIKGKINISYLDINGISNIYVEGVDDISNIDNYIKDMKDTISYKNVINVINSVLGIKNDIAKEDEFRGCFEWKLSKTLNEMGIKSITDLTYEDLSSILKKTALAARYRGKESNLVYKSGTDYEFGLADGGKVWAAKLFDTTLVKKSKLIGDEYYIIKLYDSNNELKSIYITTMWIRSLIDNILSMYNLQARKAGLDKIITSNEYKDNFVSVFSSEVNSFIARGGLKYNIDIAISKANGLVYMFGVEHLINTDDFRYYPILYFKSLGDILCGIQWLKNTDSVNYEDIHYIMLNMCGRRNDISNGYISMMRQAVLSNDYNSVILPENYMKLWEQVYKEYII
ncbi:MAG: leucine-rich repeat protein [Candidatus Anstonellales archaeon]